MLASHGINRRPRCRWRSRPPVLVPDRHRPANPRRLLHHDHAGVRANGIFTAARRPMAATTSWMRDTILTAAAAEPAGLLRHRVHVPARDLPRLPRPGGVAPAGVCGACRPPAWHRSASILIGSSWWPMWCRAARRAGRFLANLTDFVSPAHVVAALRRFLIMSLRRHGAAPRGAMAYLTLEEQLLTIRSIGR